MRYLILTDDGEVERDGDGAIVFHDDLAVARRALREMNDEQFNGFLAIDGRLTWARPWKLCELTEVGDDGDA